MSVSRRLQDSKQRRLVGSRSSVSLPTLQDLCPPPKSMFRVCSPSLSSNRWYKVPHNAGRPFRSVMQIEKSRDSGKDIVKAT
jgi:hypothetical protein